MTEGRREGGRRKKEREGGRKRGKEGGRKRGREGGGEGGRTGGRGHYIKAVSVHGCLSFPSFLLISKYTYPGLLRARHSARLTELSKTDRVSDLQELAF